MQNALCLGALGQNVQQFALGAAADTQYRGLQRVDAVAAPVQLGAYRVDQKRQIMVQHFDGGMRGLPAMTFVVGVVDTNLRLGVIETLQHAPG